MTEFNQERFNAAYQIVQACAGRPLLAQPTLYVFSNLSSTNQTAWDLFEQGSPIATTIIALEQTAGRGQWGRQWTSAPGGLYLSMVLTPDLPSEQAAQLTLCTAWGIATALRELPPKLSGTTELIEIGLKWLNDLVLHRRKLGGILTETRLQQGRITKAVVGVGINWTNPVPDTGINLQSVLASTPTPLIESLEMLAALTAYGLLSGYERWQQQGIEPILLEYVELLAHRDRPIVINGQSGKIVGVTATGELRVQLPTTAALSSQTVCDSEVLLKPSTISLSYPL
ncbi:biotin--[acetyl-CoA-carboxylase] ligase [Pantanalinema sp. GBBB05]|uniref:biotin--[acetyl-CoA-carboxylase] ligase n=1 Tax=Pantanalinema sp. GBBB05 TaxID=2604139 RepID=UPI001D3BB0B5|nr:biotin--[acetyl-CoA-carboxylase] ligase [Pantanalinema sp. GBBB05]